MNKLSIYFYPSVPYPTISCPNIRWLHFITILLLSAPFIHAQTPPYVSVQNFCTTGGQTVNVSGIKSTNTVLATYPRCTVTVYNTGTLTLATIYKDSSGTPLTNPFTANVNASWLFYVANTGGQAYDIVMSGGTPIAFPQPFTLVGVFPNNAGTSGGGGSGNVVGQVNRVGSFSNSTTTRPTNGTVDTAGNQFTYPAITIQNTGTGSAPFTLNQICTNPTSVAPGTLSRYSCNLWSGSTNFVPSIGQNPSASVYQQIDWKLTGPGMNPGVNGAVNTFQEAGGGGPIWNITTYQRGNHNGIQTNMNCWGSGDCQSQNINVQGNCNAGAGSDEGCAAIRNEVAQLGIVNGTITGGAGLGSTLINTNTNGVFIDQGYLYDGSASVGTATVTSTPTYNASLKAIAQTISGITLTPSTAWGTMDRSSVSYGSTPVGLYQNPVSVTANMTIGTSPASPGPFTVGAMTCAGPAIEYVQVTAVGAVSSGIQSVTFTSRNAWDNTKGGLTGVSCFQGSSMEGKGFIDTTQAAGSPALWPILGATDASTMIFANCIGGDCTGQNSSYVLPFNSNITIYPYAEIIGTNSGANGTAQLGFNNVNWVNGHFVVEAIGTSAVIAGMHTNIRQITPLAGNSQGLNGIIQQGSYGYLVADVGVSPILSSYRSFNSWQVGNPTKNLPISMFASQGNYQNYFVLQTTPVSGGCIICVIGANGGEGASFTGSISGGILTVTSVSSGFIISGQELLGAGIPSPCEINQFVHNSGTYTGVGQYMIANCGNPTISSQAMTTVKGDVGVFNIGVQGGTSNISLTYNAASRIATFNIANSNGPLNLISSGLTLAYTAGIGTRCLNTSSVGVVSPTTGPCGTVTGLTLPSWATQSTSSGVITIGLPTFTTTNPGVVPNSGGGTVNFLRADGNWANPLSGGITSSFTITTTTGTCNFTYTNGLLTAKTGSC